MVRLRKNHSAVIGLQIKTDSKQAIPEGGRGESGFTLPEVILAISFTAILLGVLAQLLFGGVRIWERIGRGYERQHQLLLIDRWLRNDLGALITGQYLPEAAIRGDQSKLEFWSRSSSGVVKVQYNFDSASGTVNRATGFWGENAVEQPVLKTVSEWHFEYFDPVSENWLLSWNPQESHRIPALIGVTVKTRDFDLGRLVFPIPGAVSHE